MQKERQWQSPNQIIDRSHDLEDTDRDISLPVKGANDDVFSDECKAVNCGPLMNVTKPSNNRTRCVKTQTTRVMQKFLMNPLHSFKRSKMKMLSLFLVRKPKKGSQSESYLSTVEYIVSLGLCILLDRCSIIFIEYTYHYVMHRK